MIPFEIRFWSKVSKGSKKSCWLWKAGTDENGYGKFSYKGSPQLAHRISLGLCLGRDLSKKECALHKCDNPGCANPHHLFVGTVLDNNRDMMRKGRFRHHGGFLGSKNPASKLTEDDVRWMRSRFTGKRGQCSAMARFFEVRHDVVSEIVRNKTWRHV